MVVIDGVRFHIGPAFGHEEIGATESIGRSHDWPIRQTGVEGPLDHRKVPDLVDQLLLRDIVIDQVLLRDIVIDQDSRGDGRHAVSGAQPGVRQPVVPWIAALNADERLIVHLDRLDRLAVDDLLDDLRLGVGHEVELPVLVEHHDGAVVAADLDVGELDVGELAATYEVQALVDLEDRLTIPLAVRGYDDDVLRVPFGHTINPFGSDKVAATSFLAVDESLH